MLNIWKIRSLPSNILLQCLACYITKMNWFVWHCSVLMSVTTTDLLLEWCVWFHRQSRNRFHQLVNLCPLQDQRSVLNTPTPYIKWVWKGWIPIFSNLVTYSFNFKFIVGDRTNAIVDPSINQIKFTSTKTHLHESGRTSQKPSNAVLIEQFPWHLVIFLTLWHIYLHPLSVGILPSPKYKINANLQFEDFLWVLPTYEQGWTLDNVIIHNTSVEWGAVIENCGGCALGEYLEECGSLSSFLFYYPRPFFSCQANL